jgi:hypothetical protein
MGDFEMINPFLFGLRSEKTSLEACADPAAGLAEAEAQRARGKAEHVEDRLDRLVLVNMALWSLIQEKTGLSEQDLMDRVQQVDLADGQLDGKARKPLAKCPDCDRVMSPRHKRCLYCGADRLDYSAVDSAR